MSDEQEMVINYNTDGETWTEEGGTAVFSPHDGDYVGTAEISVKAPDHRGEELEELRAANARLLGVVEHLLAHRGLSDVDLERHLRAER